jgi:hypothetical protein
MVAVEGGGMQPCLEGGKREVRVLPCAREGGSC